MQHVVKHSFESILQGWAENIFSSAWFSFCFLFMQCVSSFRLQAHTFLMGGFYVWLTNF